MKRFVKIFILGLALATMPTADAANPFGENELAINKAGKPATTIAMTPVASVDIVDYNAVAKAMETLAEASDNYSKLLKKFAADPKKFGDASGDYREFVKELTDIGKRLGELSEKLNKLAAGMKKPDAKAKPAKSTTVSGTVIVGTSLNVRTSPWGPIIGSLHDNDKVKIVGKDGDWYKISHNGKTAYIHSNYVETAEKKAGTTKVVRDTPAATKSKPASKGGSKPSAKPKAAPAAKPSGGSLTAAPCQPMPSRVSSPYGWRIHPTLKTRRFHDGIDLPVPNNTRLNALGNGTVVAVGYEAGGGKFIKVRYDNGYESFYCHLKSYSVKKGARVAAGQEIARSDNTGQWTTGAHLHFGLKKNGKSVNPYSSGIPLP